jgi:aspartyl-tRNA(Asn)/glutamyl-tRNA(Gln) amidotransferase subunit B
VLRLKEDADDYRYFPDPDLLPMVISEEEIERIRSEVPELAEQKRERFQSEYGLSEYDANQLTATRALSDFFEGALQALDESKQATLSVAAKQVANWILRDVMQALKERDQSIEDSALSSEGLAALIRLVEDGKTTAKSARGLIAELAERGGDPAVLVEERGLGAVSDAGLIERVVAEVIAEHPENVELFRAGETKVVNFLMGQVMRKTQGKADPGAVRDILARELGK